MTVRHRQRKGAKGNSFLYVRGKAFSKPPTFPPKPPEADGTWANNPSRPASFLRQFSSQHSLVARPFRGKKGLFCPQRPPYPPPKGARTPRFAPAPPGFCPARPGKALARARKGPGFSPGTPAHTAPDARKRSRVRLFAPLAPARAPPAARKSPAAAETPPAKSAAQPVAAARRRGSSRPPRQGTALGQGNPDCRGRLSRFAVEKCSPPRGDQIPGHDG